MRIFKHDSVRRADKKKNRHKNRMKNQIRNEQTSFEHGKNHDKEAGKPIHWRPYRVLNAYVNCDKV